MTDKNFEEWFKKEYGEDADKRWLEDDSCSKKAWNAAIDGDGEGSGKG